MRQALTSRTRKLIFCAAIAASAACSNAAPGTNSNGNGGATDTSNAGTDNNTLVPISNGNDDIVTPPGQPLSGNNTVLPNNTPTEVPGPSVRLVGRFDTSDANRAIMSWPGSQIIAGFTGTSLTISLLPIDQQTYYNIGNVDNYIEVSVDGGTAQILRITQGNGTYSLARGLAPGKHTVVVTKRTEGQIGSLAFSGFTVDNNATMSAAPAAFTRHIEFIGDSGTVGYGSEGNGNPPSPCRFTPQTENANISYAAVTARRLSAELHLTGNSGKGIYRNRDSSDENTLPVLWGWTVGDNQVESPVWDGSVWQAQAIVLIVGGNDFASENNGNFVYAAPNATAYNNAATAFLRRLRNANKDAYIFVGISPMMDNGVLTASRQYAERAATSMADPKIVYIDMPLDDGSRGYGCDGHMNRASHALVADFITRTVGARLGWSISP